MIGCFLCHFSSCVRVLKQKKRKNKTKKLCLYDSIHLSICIYIIYVNIRYNKTHYFKTIKLIYIHHHSLTHTHTRQCLIYTTLTATTTTTTYLCCYYYFKKKMNYCYFDSGLLPTTDGFYIGHRKPLNPPHIHTYIYIHTQPHKYIYIYIHTQALNHHISTVHDKT